MSLRVRPISQRDAFAYIDALHRHHRRPQGWKFGLAAYDGDRLCGVAVVGRPQARLLDNGERLEVTRLCTDGTKGACSLLYAAAARAAKAMGYTEILTYILEEETGTSLRASGWSQDEGQFGGGGWDRPGRSREDKHPTTPKKRWRRVLNPAPAMS